MKIKLLLILLLTFVCGAVQPVEAQTVQQLKVQVGKQKKVFKNKITVKFVSVLEDSRCPEGTNCVWAGNAKVQIKARGSNGAWKTLEINSGLDPQSVAFEGYEIKLINLTPTPKMDVKINPKGYIATFTVRKL